MAVILKREFYVGKCCGECADSLGRSCAVVGCSETLHGALGCGGDRLTFSCSLRSGRQI